MYGTTALDYIVLGFRNYLYIHCSDSCVCYTLTAHYSSLLDNNVVDDVVLYSNGERYCNKVVERDFEIVLTFPGKR